MTETSDEGIITYIFDDNGNIIRQLRTIITVESVAYVSLDTIVSIGMEGALSGRNSKEMTDEVLMEMLDAITEIEDCYERGL